MRIRTQNIRNDDAFLLHGNAEELSSALPEGMIFLLLALLILLFGLSMLYSTSFAQTGTGMFMKQVMWSGIGMMMFTGVVLIGHDRIASFSPFLLAGLIILINRSGCHSAQPESPLPVTFDIFCRLGLCDNCGFC